MNNIEYINNRNGVQTTYNAPRNVRIRKKFFRSNRSLKIFQKPYYCYICSTPVNTPTRKLKGKWTVEISQDLISYSHPETWQYAREMEKELTCAFVPSLLNNFQ